MTPPAPTPAPPITRPLWLSALRWVVHVVQFAAAAWRWLCRLVHVATVLSWPVLCLGLLALTFVHMVSLILGGDTLYSSPSYAVLRYIPGGMRVYGVVLALLWGTSLYAYGRARGGRGQVLRWCLALVAAWYVGWALIVAGTCVIGWTIYSTQTIANLLFVAWISLLVGRATPPDAG